MHPLRENRRTNLLVPVFENESHVHSAAKHRAAAGVYYLLDILGISYHVIPIVIAANRLPPLVWGYEIQCGCSLEPNGGMIENARPAFMVQQLTQLAIVDAGHGAAVTGHTWLDVRQIPGEVGAQ